VTYALHLGDCLAIMRGMDDCSVDACITDPPYGLSKEPDTAEVLRHWLAGDTYEHSGAGFMGKSWDSFVPGPEYWREVYRVMKPGAHLLCFAGTRTWDLMSMAIRLAGFENRDTIAHFGAPALAWVTGQGFPKSLAIDKAIDKAAGVEREIVGFNEDAQRRACKNNFEQFSSVNPSNRGVNSREFAANAGKITAPATDAAKKWAGWGTNLKPAWETILVFRKPLAAKNIAANVLQHGCGALNIDQCRVSANWDTDPNKRGWQGGNSKTIGVTGNFGCTGDRVAQPNSAGRFPPNLVLSHVGPDANGQGGCTPRGVKRVKGGGGVTPREVGRAMGPHGAGTRQDTNPGVPQRYHDPDGTETVAAWDCDESACPVFQLDRQSGVRKSGKGGGASWGHAAGTHEGWKRPAHVNYQPKDPDAYYGDTGGASRFFHCFPADPPDVPFRYQPKAPKSERAGSSHPTQKPLSLMIWLSKLICGPGGVILDPFAGSGTTGVAALRSGFSFVGIEQDPIYHAEAERRLQAALSGQMALPLGAD
jgi:hypothetical protein